jgi:hypothetical protein
MKSRVSAFYRLFNCPDHLHCTRPRLWGPSISSSQADSNMRHEQPLNSGRLTSPLARLALVAGLSALSSASLAQTVGPDVIVGDLQDVDNSFGTTGSPAKRMYAVGTYSCNIGDQDLNWVDECTPTGIPCNQHPVISNNMYRLMTTSGSTRFEQVGQAWLKHGFCALADSLCATCSASQDCDFLHPNCSDPYSASLNGTVSGLGPKGEVNPVTGAFPFPWINDGAGGSGSPAKRLQVAVTDLDSGLAAGALWFVSSMYVHPQDATLHNNNNNESYRRITVGPSGGVPSYALTLQDSTQRTKPAIYAWKDHGLGLGVPDPNVIITTVDIAGDGRFLVAAKATNTGAVTNPWHYEYAIQNLNSDRAGQAFSIPIPAGAATANIGFHDVDYNNGDGLSQAQPYSLTDWTGAAAGSAVTWSTQTYDVNQAANALRWDTIYNFRFDCNQPPSGGVATLTLFKPGTPSTVSINTVVPSPDGQSHPVNDACANAIDVGPGTTSFSNINAGTDGPDEPGACTAGSYTNLGADVWFRYTAGSCASGPTTISTCGSSFDTKIAVYPASPCPSSAGTFIACDDDSSVCGAGSVNSSVNFTAAANTAYLIRVGGYNAATGTGTLTITPPSCGPTAPVNDNCANAMFIADNAAVMGTTINATNDVTGTCGSNTTGPDVWYAYRPLTSATVNVNTCGSYPGYDTVLSVYSGTCGALTLLGCNDDSSSGGNNACGTGNYASGMNIAMTAGTTYFIRVAGYNNVAGNFALRAVGGGGTIPPANDDCAARAGIGLGPTSFSNINCTTDGPAHAACNSGGNNTITGDLWWNFLSTFTGRLKVDTCSPSTNFNTKIAVYSGSGCSSLDARVLACNDDDTTCGLGRSSVTVRVSAGQDYTLRVGGFNGATGNGVLTLTQLTGCGSADFNHDGDLGTDSDIEAFFACLAGNCCPTCDSADFNGDGDLGTDADIEAFFRVLGGGTC